MAHRLNRRKFLSQGTLSLAAGSAALCAVPESEAKPAKSSRVSAKTFDYYETLGITPLINAAGTYTVLSASTMPDQVQASIALAAKHQIGRASCRERV